MWIESEKLKKGDTLKSKWTNNKTIIDFKEYKGVFDFVDRIAVFHDGTKMSLTKGHFYETTGMI